MQTIIQMQGSTDSMNARIYCQFMEGVTCITSRQLERQAAKLFLNRRTTTTRTTHCRRADGPVGS